LTSLHRSEHFIPIQLIFHCTLLLFHRSFLLDISTSPTQSGLHNDANSRFTMTLEHKETHGNASQVNKHFIRHSAKQESQNRVYKSILVLGSSGGGGATLGHTHPQELLHVLDCHLGRINARVQESLYVSLDSGRGFDSVRDLMRDSANNLAAKQTTGVPATLYKVRRSSQQQQNQHQQQQEVHDTNNVLYNNYMDVVVAKRGDLIEINAYCQEHDNQLAVAIQQGIIHGIICISCHIPLFPKTFQAAADHGITVTGSGGTSLAQLSFQYPMLRLVGNAGGSVAGNTYARAVSYTHAFAMHYKLSYRSWQSLQPQGSSSPSIVSVFESTLPVVWGVVLLRAILNTAVSLASDKSTALAMLLPKDAVILSQFKDTVVALETFILPTVCSIMVTISSFQSTLSSHSNIPTSVSQSTPSRGVPLTSLIMTATLASITSSRSVLSGLLAGQLVVWTWEDFFCICITRLKVPTTMAQMLSVGGLGMLLALGMIPISQLLRYASGMVRHLILMSVSLPNRPHRCLAGALWGLWSCYGSQVGWYHAYHLPLILLEMEEGHASFLGAVDELTLVMISAGICAANMFTTWLVPVTCSLLPAEKDLCKRGLRYNLLCGDFVEVCYPYMDASYLIKAGAYISSAGSCAWIATAATSADRVAQSSAYFPWPISVLLASDLASEMTLASLIAFAIPFLCTVISNLYVGYTCSTRRPMRKTD
jgi:hypothetical protein